MESIDEAQKCPKILYKYCGFEGGRATLENSSLRYRHPNEFNDPFEFLPGGYSDDTFENTKKACVEIISQRPNILSMINKYLGTSYSFNQLKNHIEHDDNPELNKIIDLIFSQLKGKDWEEFRNEASKEVVFCSFSKKKDDILMWSHYADEHKGMVIGFDASYFNCLWEIQYQDQRVLIPLTSMLNPINRKKTAEMIIRTKYTTWKYEKEWRQIIPTSMVNSNGDILTRRFEPDAVKSIILGYKVDNVQEAQIISLQAKYPNCETIQHAKLSKQNFALEFV